MPSLEEQAVIHKTQPVGTRGKERGDKRRWNTVDGFGLVLASKGFLGGYSEVLG